MNDLGRRLKDGAGGLDDNRNRVSDWVRTGNVDWLRNRNRYSNGMRNWNLNVVFNSNWDFMNLGDCVRAVDGVGNGLVHRHRNIVTNFHGVRLRHMHCYRMGNRNMDILGNLNLVRLRNLLGVLAGDVSVTVFGDLNWGRLCDAYSAG